MPRTNEVRKECPSCGLGVPLDSKICEFCGWDFEEEDEWILQIEKLEQELMLERQKFDDTSVDRMIESTLRKPQREPRPKDKAVSERPAKATPPIKSRPKRTPPQSVEEIEAELGLVDSSESDTEEEVISLDLDDIEPPPPEEAVEGKGPKIVKARPEIPRPTPSSGKKVRRIVTRTIPAGSQTMPAQGKVRRVVRTSSQAGVKTRAESPARPIDRPRPSSRAAPAEPAAEKSKRPKKSKGLFGDLGKIFSMPEPEIPPKKKSEPQARKKEPASQKRRSDSEKPSAKSGKKERKEDTKTEKSADAEEEEDAKDKNSRKSHTEVSVFICPLCNKEVPEDSRICSGCGAEFE